MSRSHILTRISILFLLVLVGFAARQAPGVIAAPPTDLILSEYVEGSGNDKALEIYNDTGVAIDPWLPVSIQSGCHLMATNPH